MQSPHWLVEIHNRHHLRMPFKGNFINTIFLLSGQWLCQKKLLHSKFTRNDVVQISVIIAALNLECSTLLFTSHNLRRPRLLSLLSSLPASAPTLASVTNVSDFWIEKPKTRKDRVKERGIQRVKAQVMKRPEKRKELGGAWSGTAIER